MASASLSIDDLYKALSGGRLGFVEGVCRERLVDDQSNADFYRLLGLVFIRKGQPQDALPVLVRANQLSANHAATLTDLADALSALEQHKAAFDIATTATQRDPAYHPARLRQLQEMEAVIMADPTLAGDRPAVRPLGPVIDGPMISVVLCSIDDGKFARAVETYRAVLGPQVEIIAIRNARSLCEGYTRGLRVANGEILILTHDDVEILADDFEARLRAHMDHCDLLGIAGTTRLTGATWIRSGWQHQRGFVPHKGPDDTQWRVETYGLQGRLDGGIQALDGVFLAGWRRTFDTIAFDADTFDGFHLYDIDYSFRCHRAGLRVAVANDLCIAHQSTGARGASFDAWQIYEQRFQTKLGGQIPDEPAGSHLLRAVHVDTRDRVRAFNAAVLAIAEGRTPDLRWTPLHGPERPPANLP